MLVPTVWSVSDLNARSGVLQNLPLATLDVMRIRKGVHMTTCTRNEKLNGTGTNIFFAIGECSLGSLLVGQSTRGVCSILIGEDPTLLARDLRDQFPEANLIGSESGYEQLVAKVVSLIENPGTGLDLPLDIRGTAFQQRVWHALQEIPSGSTASYTDIANQIGTPGAVRAVARACGANALAVVIPCHRVIRNDGSLSGYRWGVERKRALLEREAHA
jgi:AraC family transcriptional regulator of adaptative response/methylated-DNA-[protein]-cysteine methyltransferase